jgi:phosphatidylglycerol lysyltransferase
MMIGLTPQLPVSDVLGSILAYRIVYYAVPAVFAAISLALPFKSKVARSQLLQANLKHARNAELGIIAQNGGHTLATRDGACAVWPTGQTLTALCDPIKGSANAALCAVSAAAKSNGRIPMTYKCSGKTAMAARKLGWSALHISDDALVDPLEYAPNVPSGRRLRRKLRNAEKSGLTLQSSGPPPWAEMARIDAAWQNTHGTARGGTMGRFEQGYLRDHLIMRGYIDGKLVAFASFQRSTQEWCLDVMRHSIDAPDGTMHALVHHAIICARHAAIGRVNLAAVPACPDPGSAFFRWAARVAIIKAGGTGLRQFKSAFSPRWSARYAAAPTPFALAIGLADIAREVHTPPPIVPTAPKITREIHNNDENYVLAS